MHRTLLVVLSLCALAVAADQQVRSPEGRTTWRDYGGGPDSSKFVTSDQINKSNLHALEVLWTYPVRDNLSYNFGPVIVDDVAYVLARNNALVALDTTTGQEIWVHEGLQGIAPRGINYWESADRKDRRLLYQRNHYLEAIDAVTGKPILSFGTDGAVNLREGLGRDPATVGRVQSQNPGKIFENLILLGSATGENYLATPGDLRAFDVVTGKLVWQFRTIPHPGEYGYDTWPKDAYKYVGGANTWGEVSVDAARGIAYFPTGSPTYDFYGADRHGANLFGSSLVALDARTGKRLWHFQMVHHDLWDYDNAAAPVLTTIRRNGKPVDVVAQAGKTGFLYVFDRVTGEPIWPIEERPVPKSDVPGEQAWPTQPFPTAPPPFAKQTLSPDDVNTYLLTSDQQAQWRRRIAGARNDGLFTPPSLVDTVSIPGAQGGANWGTTAANPYDGTVYVLSINVPSIYRLTLDEPAPPAGRGGQSNPIAVVERGLTVYIERCQTCHMANLEGNGVNVRSLVGITALMGPDTIREAITGGRPGMPSVNDLAEADLSALLAFLGTPDVVGRGRGMGAPMEVPPSFGGPVVASGGAPGNRPGAMGRGGMIGPPYPEGVAVPPVRYYTGYGMVNNLVSPPYSTLTAYDLNTGTIRWQVPAGGDDPHTLARGGRDTGYIRARTGIISTAAGLVFHAGGDARLRVYDAADGTVLWSAPLPAGSQGIPAMAEVKGRQVLIVNAAQGGLGRGGAPPTSPPPVVVPGRDGAPPPRGYVAFGLRGETTSSAHRARP